MKKATFLVGMILLSSLSSSGYTKTNWINVPIDVRFLKASQSSPLDMSSEKGKFTSTLRVVNDIYKQAKIKFVLKSNKTHSVTKAERNEHLRVRNKKPYNMINETKSITSICPKAVRKNLLVCVIERFKVQSFGGVASEGSRIIVMPSRAGHLKKMNPGALAHELGHLLSLPHAKTKDNNNLMKSGATNRRSSGYNKLKLTDKQINKARKKARSIIK